MFKNYLTVAIRVLRNNKAFSFLNILGLALGMACSLLILLWVKDERSVDAFHVNNPRLYSLFEREFADNKITADYDTPAPLGEELKKEIPEIAFGVSADWDDDYTFQGGGKILKQKGGFATEDFFKIFSFPILEGKAANAIKEPVDIAISKKMAVDFFGSPAAAMGKTLRKDKQKEWKDFKVTAVFDDVPENSTLRFDYLINWQAFYEEYPYMRNWGNSAPRTTILLRPDANPALVAAKVKRFLEKFSGDKNSGHRVELGMLPFGEGYLHNRFKDGEVSGGRIEYVRLFSIIAVFILLIACINFMNLTTARSAKRAKEIGVRKVVGAMRGALIRQFIGEAILLAFLAAIVALLLVGVLLPFFNSITGKQILLPGPATGFWWQLAGLALITGCISGSYPALFLSSLQPVKVLKGKMKTGRSATLFRKGLVVFQFVLSIVLIIGTIIVTQQVHYIQTSDPGFKRENLVYIPIEGDLIKKYSLFKEQAMQLPGIQSMSRMTEAPTSIDNGTGSVDWDGKPAGFKPSFIQASVGYDFTRTTNVRLLEGRDFSKAYPRDSIGYILNEAAIKKTGYKDPVGRNLTFWGHKGTIVGVIKDFHFASLHDPINPLVLRLNEQEEWGNILVRTEAGKTRQALTGLEKLCKELNPSFPFTYQFADEEYQKIYKSEQVIGALSNYFAFLAIFISCLGLLGLAMFTAEQRTKEIGIRKVLGATSVQLFSLLSGEFLLLVLIALVIASPIAWWTMHRWLQDYAYRAPISWTVFLIAGVLAVLIALITVSFQAIKAALANPVVALRGE